MDEVQNVQKTLNEMFEKLNELELKQKGGSILTPSIPKSLITNPEVISNPSIPNPETVKIIGGATDKFTHIFLKGALFIAVVVSLIALLKRLPLNAPQDSWRVLPYAIGSVAAFWTIERVVSFLPVAV